MPAYKKIKNLDDKLQSGDERLVNKITKVGLKNKNGKKIIFYSFATKFCSHHNSKDFAIYDSYVEKILMYFKKGNFSNNFTKKDYLKESPKFKKVLFDFRKHYQLNCNLKELDRYLWQLGRKYFSKNN